MTKIKFCGLKRLEDIECANRLKPEYVGFVFAEKSRRRITADWAAELKKNLNGEIKSVGVFVNESRDKVAALLNGGVIDIAQLHGEEDESYINSLKSLTGKPVIKAFPVKSAEDVAAAIDSTADHILFDSGAGTGEKFDWRLIKGVGRDYFLAGGISPANAREAIDILHPYALDVSSEIETGGFKDEIKMAAFIRAVRKDNRV